jgi:hypothetical protein
MKVQQQPKQPRAAEVGARERAGAGPPAVQRAQPAQSPSAQPLNGATEPDASYDSGAEPPIDHSPPAQFQETAETYGRGLSLGSGNAPPAFADRRAALAELVLLARNPLAEIAERMGPSYAKIVQPGSSRRTLALALSRRAQAQGELAELAAIAASVSAQVPPLEVTPRERVQFPALRPASTHRTLRLALASLDRDQLDYLAVSMGELSLDHITSGKLPAAAREMVVHYHSHGRLEALAKAIEAAPAGLATAAPVGDAASLKDVVARLHALDDHALRTAAAAVGIDLQDVRGATRLGMAIDIARQAYCCGQLAALIDALKGLSP